MRRLGDAWSSKSVNSKIPLPYAISVPHKFNDKAEVFYADEFSKLRGAIEKEYDCKITDEALEKTIKLYNYSRRLMIPINLLLSLLRVITKIDQIFNKVDL